jgi:hypothetical protein
MTQVDFYYGYSAFCHWCLGPLSVGSHRQQLRYNKEGAVKTPDLLFTLLLREKSSSSCCTPVPFSSRPDLLSFCCFLGRPWSSSFRLAPLCFPRCCFLGRLWSPPFHLLPLCFLFFVRCRLVSSVMSTSFYFFFDLVYCSHDAV